MPGIDNHDILVRHMLIMNDFGFNTGVARTLITWKLPVVEGLEMTM